MGASEKGGVGKFIDFLALSVNISKTVADTAKVNRKSYMGFRLTPRSMTLDDPELIVGISRDFATLEATRAKRMKIDL